MAAGTMKAIWQNRRHFKMQIFGVMVLFVVVVFIVNLVSIKVSYNKQLDNYLSSVSKYTTSFQMSLSGVKGTVNKVYVDTARKQSFVLMKLNGTSNLAMNAGNYQVLLTNVNRDGSNAGCPEEQVEGEIYMFGSSGLIGLYFRSDIPFENQLKQITLRSYAKFTSNTKPYTRISTSDAQYDQCHIYFNPGGTSAQTIDFLENHVAGTNFDPVEIQRQVNTVNDEIAIRNDILKFYDNLLVCMDRITEYQRRLRDNYNVEVPEFPMYIKGDYFDTIDIYGQDGTVVGSYRKFIPATIMPGGTEYDWYMGSINKGYYNLVPNAQNISIPDYIAALSADKNSRRYTYKKTEEWFYLDGTAVKSEFGSMATSYEQEVWNNIMKYEELLVQYMDLKEEYQTEYLPELLTLEYKSAGVGIVYTVRNDDNAVILYPQR